jgi:hypothetical protein
LKRAQAATHPSSDVVEPVVWEELANLGDARQLRDFW